MLTYDTRWTNICQSHDILSNSPLNRLGSGELKIRCLEPLDTWACMFKEWFYPYMICTVQFLYHAMFGVHRYRTCHKRFTIFKETIFQRNYRKMTISSPCFYNSFAKFHGKNIWELHHDRVRVKPVSSSHSKRRPKMVFKTYYRRAKVLPRGAFCHIIHLH